MIRRAWIRWWIVGLVLTLPPVLLGVIGARAQSAPTPADELAICRASAGISRQIEDQLRQALAQAITRAETATAELAALRAAPGPKKTP